eukprot:scaffold114_cov361-Pinguiococcus_pyrenoidosus.AAC.43
MLALIPALAAANWHRSAEASSLPARSPSPQASPAGVGKQLSAFSEAKLGSGCRKDCRARSMRIRPSSKPKAEPILVVGVAL